MLEEIVGEIDDEHDPPAPQLTGVLRPGEWRLEGSLHPDEVFDACGFEVPDGDYETLAGFVLAELGTSPTRRAVRPRGWERVAALDGLRVVVQSVVASAARRRRAAP